MVLDLVVFLSKALLYGTALATVGLALHHALEIGPPRRGLLIASLLLLAATGLRALVLNAQVMGGWDGFSAFDLFPIVWAGNARALSAFAAGAVIGIAAAWGAWRPVGVLAALAVASGFGLGGHTQSLETPGLLPWLVAAHVLIAGFWIVAPLTLWPRVPTSPDRVAWQTERFSSVALWVIPVLFVTGIWLLLALAGGVGAVLGSTYGRLLSVKLLLATALLGLGALNKLHVTRRLRLDPLGGRIVLRRVLTAEAVLFVLVVGTLSFATSFTGPSGG